MAPKTSSSSKRSVKAASMKRQRPQSTKLHYLLYLHQQELRKRKISAMGILHTKSQLTDELIRNTVKNIHNCSRGDLQILNREMILNDNLQRQIARVTAHQKEQYNKFKRRQQKSLAKLQRQQNPTSVPQQQPNKKPKWQHNVREN